MFSSFCIAVRWALTALLAGWWPAVAWAGAEGASLYVWSDRLALHAAPAFSAEVVGELAYGEAVVPLAAAGPLEPGGGVYPWRRRTEEDEWRERKTHPARHPFFLHGRWLKLRSVALPAREGFAFDSALLPLPAPSCAAGAAACDPVVAFGAPSCAGDSENCESIEDYSARAFGLLKREERSEGEWQEIDSRYGGDVAVHYATTSDGLLQTKQWTLPMLHSPDQAHARRFFSDCIYMYGYDPAREIVIGRCGDIGGASVILTRGSQGILIDWGYMD